MSKLTGHVSAGGGRGADGIVGSTRRSVQEPAKYVVSRGKPTGAVGRERIGPGREHSVELIPDTLDRRGVVVVVIERTLAAAT